MRPTYAVRARRFTITPSPQLVALITMYCQQRVPLPNDERGGIYHARLILRLTTAEAFLMAPRESLPESLRIVLGSPWVCIDGGCILS